MRRTIKAYIKYIKDNPEGYWFKRRAFGWGWVPATREGWLVLAAFVLIVLGIAWRAEYTVTTDAEALTQVLLPVLIVTVILLVICYKTGERPRWQWRIPAKYFQD